MGPSVRMWLFLLVPLRVVANGIPIVSTNVVRTWKLSYNITPRVRLQCQHEVIAELSIFDSRVEAVDPLIDIGPTPA